MTLALLLLCKAAVVAVVFSIGLLSAPADAAWLLRRPRLLARSLLAMYVIVPVAALALTRLVPLQPAVQIALLVLAESAGAPLLPRKLEGVGSGAYIFSLGVISSVLSIVLLPAWIAFLDTWFTAPEGLTPGQVAWILAKAFFMPLLAGLAVRHIVPVRAEPIGRLVMRTGGVVLMGAALVLLVIHWDVLLQARPEGALALAALIVIALISGHCLGGPEPGNRTTLAIACATRHPGVAVIVAASLPGPRTLVMVALYFLISAAFSLPYLWWRRRTGRGGLPAASVS